MYLEFYGLKEPPFSITPDPRFVYLSERHRDALAHLLYGIGQGGSGGFVQLTGEVGTGKTTLSRLLLEQLPEDTTVALVLNPRLSPVELVETICEELHCDLSGRRGSLKSLVDALNAYLLEAYAARKRVVVIIDEAQELSRAALEQVRLLTNLETPSQKLLQIVLLGQPELRELLERPELRQLAQRVTARYHLTPLDENETDAYLRHRLAVAGCQRFPFTKLAVRRIHQRAGGVPRLINVIADRSLLAGFARDQPQIGERLVERAAGETIGARIKGLTALPAIATAVVGIGLVIALLLWLPKSNVGTGTAPKPAMPIEAPAAAPATADKGGTRPPRALIIDGEDLALRIGDAGPSLLLSWNRLLSLWSLRAARIDAPSASRCPPVLTAGVFCLRGNATLTKLARLGRPVILHLNDDASHETWAVLLGVDALHARLSLAGERIEVDRAQLERHWDGQFVAIWRAPEFVALPIKLGDTGPAVDWLRGEVMPTEASVQVGPVRFDEELELSVKRVQARYDLLPDGIVGPETLLALVADDPDGPQLRTRLD